MYNETKSNERMNNIGLNGNDGLHYSQEQLNTMNEEILNTEVFGEIDLSLELELEKDQLITDYIMVAGFSEDDAIFAASEVLEFDNKFSY